MTTLGRLGSKKVLGFAIGIAFGAVLTYFVLWPDGYSSWAMGILATLWTTAHWMSQSIGNGAAVKWLDRQISWLEQPLKRALVGFVVLIGYSVSAFSIIQFIFLWVYFKFYVIQEFTLDLVWDNTVDSIKFGVGISFAISFVLTTIGFLKGWRKSAGEAERLRAEMMTYKYESLRNQINPHFLFNSLNTLTDLVHEDQDQAVKFIRQMSDLYRYVLDSREREVVPLQEEVDFIHSFIYLLKMRFEEKLDVHVDISVNGNERLVPMALQNLIENAVKHNEVSKLHPLRIEIVREGDAIRVSNGLRKIAVGDASTGTGLQNIRARYAYLSDRPIVVEETEKSYTVRLPILKES